MNVTALDGGLRAHDRPGRERSFTGGLVVVADGRESGVAKRAEAAKTTIAKL